MRTGLKWGEGVGPENKCFLIDVGGVIVCHLGDIGEVLSSRTLADLSHAQVMLRLPEATAR